MAEPLGEEGRLALGFVIFSACFFAVAGGLVGYLAMVENPQPVMYGPIEVHVSEGLKPVLFAIISGLLGAAGAAALLNNAAARDTVFSFMGQQKKG